MQKSHSNWRILQITMCSYQRTVSPSLKDCIYFEIEKNSISLGCISDQLNVKWETCLVVLLKSLLAECPYVAMNGFLQSATKWLQPILLVNDLASLTHLSYQCNTSGTKAFVLKKIQLVQNASVHPFDNANYPAFTIVSSTVCSGKPVNPKALQWTTHSFNKIDS